ncbi:MAG: ClbS/DfsB family four-helix bundle protein [Chloroflexi bacterium]|nr:ClbS/DfsB family four-helix bundle protein [Chloroflexota bacterium]
MPKPVTKDQLLKEILDERARLESVINTIPAEEMTGKKIFAEWTPKDVLSHLTAWEQMVILWVKSGYAGQSIPVPAEGFKWSELPALNDKIFREHKDETLEVVLQKFRQSYAQIMELLKSIPETELFTPGLQKWQNKNTLAAYFKSSTSSHYLWARKEISKGMKK